MKKLLALLAAAVLAASAFGQALPVQANVNGSTKLLTNQAPVQSGKGIDVRSFGAKGDGVTNDTTAIQAALNYANTVQTACYAPGGVYLITSTINVPNGVEFSGAGPLTANSLTAPGTTLKAGTANMLMLTMSSGSRLSRIALDGENTALWGAMVSGARPSIEDVEAYRCTEYAVVMNQTQNGTITNLNCRFNTYGLVLANGARNNSFYNFTSEVNSSTYVGTYANARPILFLIDTSNPHSFGMATTVTLQGNDQNRFFGGINERCACVIETKNPSASAQTALNNQFYGVELDGDQILKTDSTFGGIMKFDSCSFGTNDQTTPMGVGTAGWVVFSGENFFSGANTVADRGFTQNNNYHDLLRLDSNDFIIVAIGGSVSPFQLEGGGGTVTFNATTKVFSVSAGSSVQGLQANLAGGGTGRAMITVENQAYIAARKPQLKASFTIANVVGGSGKVNVYAAMPLTPFRRLIAQLPAGTYSLGYTCQGDELGAISFTQNDVTSFDVSNIKITIEGNAQSLVGSGSNLTGVLNSVSGTAGQVTVSTTSGAATVSLPSALTGINSVTSVAGQAFVLSTGTSGAAWSIASATNISTASNAVIVNGPAGGVTSYFQVKTNGTANVLFGSGAVIGGTATDALFYGQNGTNMLFYSNAILALTLTSADATFAGNASIGTVGKTLSIKSGSNAKAGTFTLTAGSATVANTSVTANSVIVPQIKTVNGTRGASLTITPTAGTGFTAAGLGTDAGTYSYVIFEVN